MTHSSVHVSARCIHVLAFVAAALFFAGSNSIAAAASPEDLFTAKDATGIKTENCTVSVVTNAEPRRLQAQFPAGDGYPGFDFPAPAKGWNLTGYSGVQVEVTNTGETPVTIALRVDNPGDWRQSPWNTESIALKPGETKTLKVTFGQSYGKPGYALDPTRVSRLKLFAVQPKHDTTVTVKHLRPFGKSE